jgi:hypothetical protein
MKRENYLKQIPKQLINQNHNKNDQNPKLFKSENTSNDFDRLTFVKIKQD